MPDIYRSTYDNPAGDSFVVQLQKADGSSATEQICDMKAVISRPAVQDPLAPIRRTECSLELEASAAIPFDDLFTEIEEQWICTVSRNGLQIFEGYVQPEGFFEDFVNDVWIISLQATDGLANLENKSYVDGSGDNYEGITGLAVILLRALNRTGFTGRDVKFQQRSVTGTEFPVRYLEGSLVSQNDYFNQTVNQRAFEDDDGTPDSCLKVIEEILGPVNGVVFYEEGAWVINWSLQHANPGINGAFKYSLYAGGAGFPSTVNQDVNRTIFAQPNAGPTDFFWIREDQRIERRPSLGATRTEYRYRGIGAANINPDLNNDEVSISGWTVSQPGAVTLNGNGTVTITAGANPSQVALAGLQIAGQFDEGTNVVLKAVWTNDVAGTNVSVAQFQVEAVGSGNTWYLVGTASDLNNPPQWSTTPGFLQYFTPPGVGEYTMEYTSPALPEDANLSFDIVDTLGAVLTFSFASIANALEGSGLGVQFTVERISNPSSYIEDPVERILADDQDGIVYLGSLLWQDTATKTTDGYTTPSSAFAFPLYQKMLVDRMLIRGKVVRLFTGSIYGYVIYNARVLVDQVAGQYVFTRWTYDTATGITSGDMFGLTWDLDDSDNTVFSKQINFGNVVNPKIRG